MNGLEQYRALTTNAQANLGVVLPDLTSGKINVTTEQYDVCELQALVEVYAPNEGWVVYRDSVAITNQAPNRSDLIEAEYYCHASEVQSIKIRHLFANQYLVTSFQVIDDKSEEYCYSEQAVIVRKNLAAQAQTALYRLWYKQDETFRWRPYAQQFIGFSTVHGQQEGK